MRDKKDYATLDLPGFCEAPPAEVQPAPAKRGALPRPRTGAITQQQQLLLLDATDATGLPLWRRDDNTDLTGLPIWAAA